ncbi:class I SAM-dependent methyltransferase [Terriglobus roseus]|nr:class I SAM-dependent methyltransferase [Terriglobus roseus]
MLRRHTVTYWYCQACGFLQTDEPHWLDEAYTSAIANADTGLVFRNNQFNRIVSALLYFTQPRDASFLDFGGGYGMFVRLMRDVGFNFFWYDRYCQNLLAIGFDASQAPGPFAAVTAFEVMEHAPDPMALVREALARAGAKTLIFSTEIFEGEPPARNWWYYAFPTGQHIAFYQRRTLQAMAAQLGLRCYSSGGIHMFTDRQIHPLLFRVITKARVASLLMPWIRRHMRSRMIEDHEALLARS